MQKTSKDSDEDDDDDNEEEEEKEEEESTEDNGSVDDEDELIETEIMLPKIKKRKGTGKKIKKRSNLIGDCKEMKEKIDGWIKTKGDNDGWKGRVDEKGDKRMGGMKENKKDPLRKLKQLLKRKHDNKPKSEFVCLKYQKGDDDKEGEEEKIEEKEIEVQTKEIYCKKKTEDEKYEEEKEEDEGMELVMRVRKREGGWGMSVAGGLGSSSFVPHDKVFNVF